MITEKPLYLCYAAPGVVGIDHVISTSINATLVAWNPPIEPNGVITGYEVVYSVYGLDAENVIGLLESDVYTINITGLSECYVNSSLSMRTCVAIITYNYVYL